MQTMKCNKGRDADGRPAFRKVQDDFETLREGELPLRWPECEAPSFHGRLLAVRPDA